MENKKKELMENLRVLKAYKYSEEKKDIDAITIITEKALVNQEFLKYAKNGYHVIAIEKGSTFCSDCLLTACWEYGKAITCNERRCEYGR